MATGTPVIAFRRGAMPEVVDDGVTGLIVDDVDAAVEAVHRVGQLDRRLVRHRFEERFTADRMARDYVALYETLAAQRRLATLPTLPELAPVPIWVEGGGAVGRFLVALADVGRLIPFRLCVATNVA